MADMAADYHTTTIGHFGSSERTGELDDTERVLDVAADVSDEGDVRRTSWVRERLFDGRRLAVSRRTGHQDRGWPARKVANTWAVSLYSRARAMRPSATSKYR